MAGPKTPPPHDPELEALVAQLAADDDATRLAAERALSDAGEPGQRALVAALADAREEVRSGACRAFTALEPPPAFALAPLTQALQDEAWGVRHHAAAALGQFRSLEAIPALCRALRDRDERVRERAYWSLITATEYVRGASQAIRQELGLPRGGAPLTERLSALISQADED